MKFPGLKLAKIEFQTIFTTVEEDIELIELKFDGNGITPVVVRASEIAEMIRSFEHALIPLIREKAPEIRTDFVFISFEEINSNCISLKCLAHKAKQYVIPAYLTLASAFQENNFDDIPKSTFEELKSITSFARRHKCDGTFFRSGEPLVTFSQDLDIKLTEKNTIKGDTTIYGTVLKAGGETPRVTLKIDNDYTVSFDVKREIAIQLATKLYCEIGLTGTAKWDKRNFHVIDFRADDIIKLEDKSLKDSFKELTKAFKPFLGGFEDFQTQIL